MKAASLFSGIGGFDLAAEQMNWENAFTCEINSFCRQILQYYWPNTTHYENIITTDFTIWRGRIDVLTGGFPCQPYSQAGKRLGKDDARHLWPEMLRAIREIRPRWIVGENVRGLTNWNGGLVFDEVQNDLENEGYEVQSFLLPACAVEAPHERYRIWIVAHANDTKPRNNTGSNNEKKRVLRWRNKRDVFGKLFSSWTTTNAKSGGCRKLRNKKSASGAYKSNQPFGCVYSVCNTTNANNKRCSTRRKLTFSNQSQFFSRFYTKATIANATSSRQSSEKHGQNESRFFTETEFSDYWRNFPSQSPICSGNDGIPTELDGITLSKWRNETIAAAGNAVVPQLVLQIFKAIQEYDNLSHDLG
jgi:DNA (cytosine-5)-methyltransferase 1